METKMKPFLLVLMLFIANTLIALTPGKKYDRWIQQNVEKPLPDEELNILGLEDFMLTEDELNKEEKEPALNGPVERKETQVADEVLKIRFANLKAFDLNIDTLIQMIYDIDATKGIERIHIAGHTDSNPIRGKRAQAKYKDNWVLSRARARLVADRLIKDFSKIPFSYEGFADTRPEASNSTAEGKALNRRTEVYIFYKKEKQVEQIQAKKGDNLLGRFGCSYGLKLPPIEVPKQEKVFVEPNYHMVVNFKVLHATFMEKDLQKVRDFIERIEHSENIDYIHITGHTDSDPIIGNAKKKFADNWDLSKHRALLVLNRLRPVLKGYQLSYEGFADTRPVASNATREGKAKNRRTEVWVYTKPRAQDTLSKNSNSCQGENCLGSSKKPFRITLDGALLDRPYYKDPSPSNHVDFQRCIDVALEKSNVQVHFNSLDREKFLNITGSHLVLNEGETMRFRPYTNYREYIEKAEIRIFDQISSTETKPYKIIPVKKNKFSFDDASWDPIYQNIIFEGSDKTFSYVLRVYDKKNRFDETEPVQVIIKRANDSNIKIQSSAPVRQQDLLNAGYGKNRLKISNIPVHGAGSIIVNGEEIPAGYDVFVMGEKIPVDPRGRFVTEQILEPGKNYGVEVQILDEHKKGMSFRRDLRVKNNDWFFVGLADITAGRNYAEGPVELIKQDDHHYQDKVWVDGRVAFYLKGKVKGKYIITASADTRERALKSIFNNFDSKDPQDLFRRIDPDKYYPVYGDDSTMIEDAPTQGKFYVKIERGDSHLMWGNFRTKQMDTELAQYDRGLYGAELNLESEKNASNGQKKSKLNLFAASPDTLASREEFRGTGGSFYWLRQRDITIGSEKIYVEVRDLYSDIVLQRNPLRYGEDYSINYLQGTVILKDVLPSTADQSQLVRAGNLSGNKVFLVVNYEYTPGFEELDNLSFGGRAHQWIGDHLKLGVTGSRQKGTGTDQELLGADVTVRLSESSYIKAEVAQSEGVGSGELASLDGGYEFNSVGQLANNEKNQAYMIESGLTIYQNDWGRGELQAYFRDREKGFSAPGQLTRYDTQQVGGKLKLPIGIARIDLSHDYKKEDQWRQKEVSSADLGFKLGKSWNVEAGIQHDKNKDLSSGIATTSLVSDFGSRLDSALEIKFVPGDEYDFYVFGQKTLNHDDSRLENDRFGIGGHYRFSNRFKLGGEFSDGDGGLGAKVRSDIAVDDRSDLYFTYQLDNRRTDNGFGERSGRQGIFVSGAKRRFGDSSNIYYEGRMDRSDYANSGLTHLFGVDLVPNNKWTVGLTIEKGDLESSDGLQKIERRAASVNLGYAGQNSKAGIALEAREETSSGNERTTYLVKSKLSSKLTQEWRFQLKLDLARSKTTQGDFYDGDWTDGSLGLAYRPINHDKWNFLFRYGYLEVLPSAGQVTSNGQIPEFKQRTHVLSADVIYDLNKYLSLGAKYGYRKGELQNNRVGGEWFENDAHLGIIRLDWHVIYQWDVLLEYRRLWQLDASQVRHGALVGIYRHLSKKKTLKIGVGYNFADFSDDLADPYYRYDGWFVNLVGGF